GRAGTLDDFSVATFTSIIAEQPRGQTAPQSVTPAVFDSSNNGAIHGTVSDSNGARVPRATVTAKRVGDEKTYQVSTDDNGVYGFANLPPRIYEVRFDAPGFSATVVTNVLVGGSNLMGVDAVLKPGATMETVDVTSSAPSFETESSATAGRSVVTSKVTTITKSGGSQLSTPRLREYFPETLLWQ